MDGITLSARIDDVDWADLKTALAADDFDNGRTPEEYRRSHENSHAVVIGRCGGEFVANGRILSDGVCNAYLVDIWTAKAYRRSGVGRAVVEQLVATVPGQHVALFTSDMQAFYSTVGFALEEDGMSRVVGAWLGRD